MWQEKFLLRHEPDFLSHLEELRKRLIVSLVFFILASILCYFYSQTLIDFLTKPIRDAHPVQLFFQKPHEAFLVHLEVAALSGFILSSPIFFVQLWFFVAPGLYEKEKKAFLSLTFISSALFFIGALFAYGIVIPWGFRFLLSFQTESLKPMLGIGPYFSFLIGSVLAFGFLFDFPVIIIGLVKLGMVKTKTLSNMRRISVILIFILAAILTPSPDPLSQMFLALPLVLLFELSLLIARKVEKSVEFKNGRGIDIDTWKI